MTARGSINATAAVLACFALLAAAGAAAADAPLTINWTWSTIATAGRPNGYAQFQAACSVCHGDGPAKPGTRALAAKYRGGEPALLEQRTDLSAELIRTMVRQGVSVMAPLRKTELSDADLDAIVAYLTRKRR